MRYGRGIVICFFTFILVTILAFDCMSHGWMAPKEAAEMKNPIALDAESARRGKAIYLENCAACHGENIEGMKAEDVGLGMDTPNLIERLNTHADGDFFWKIQQGKGDMPSFKDNLSENQIWDVINYIKHESE
jgi:mono/diheme cytochrome c family protein